jgi:hypothetical protein
MRYAFFLATAYAVASGAPSLAAEPENEAVEIPLEEIWALDMPGTQDLREVDPPDDPIVDKVLKQISESRKFDHCFVVRGEGTDALREFLRVRTDHDYWNRLPANEPLSLVFFTKPMREDVEILSVTPRGKRITVRYRYAPLNSSESVPQLAVIPIGKVEIGDFYTVSVERLPTDQRHVDAGFEETPPSRLEDSRMSCVFDAVEGPGGPPPPGELIEIPLETIWAYNMPGTKDINEFGAPRAQDSLVQQVLRQIRETWNLNSGMVVVGEGRQALENIYRKRTEKVEWSEAPAGEALSLAFYTRGINEYVHIRTIERQGARFVIRFALIPNQTLMSRPTIAIIPIGTLAAGKYSVAIERLPLDEEYIEQGIQEPPLQRNKDVCRSFDFVVVERR